jgi:hypothetical protein
MAPSANEKAGITAGLLHEKGALLRAFFGEVDPVRRQKCGATKDER